MRAKHGKKMNYSCWGKELHHPVSSQYEHASKSNYLIHTWHNDLWLNIQMVNFSRTHRTTGGMTNSSFFCWKLILNWGHILWEICFVSYISHQNYNSQGEWGSDREVRHQGQGSHLKVTFQSTQQMLPIYLSPALSPVLVLHPYLFLPPPLSASLALFLFWLSFAFLLFLTSPPPHLPPSTIPRSVTCWRGSRQEAV